jgi:hypothetical protein
MSVHVSGDKIFISDWLMVYSPINLTFHFPMTYNLEYFIQKAYEKSPNTDN